MRDTAAGEIKKRKGDTQTNIYTYRYIERGIERQIYIERQIERQINR